MSGKTRVQFDREGTRRRVRGGAFRSLDHAAAAMRLTAKRSIKPTYGASRVGNPPHTHRGRLPASIVYYVDRARARAYIGPSYRIIGIAGAEHEHGKKFRRETFKPRPFMRPALEKLKTRLPSFWAGSVR